MYLPIRQGFIFRKGIIFGALGILYGHTRQTFVTLDDMKKKKAESDSNESNKQKVQSYAKQLEEANRLLEKYRILHPDLEPKTHHEETAQPEASTFSYTAIESPDTLEKFASSIEQTQDWDQGLENLNTVVEQAEQSK